MQYGRNYYIINSWVLLYYIRLQNYHHPMKPDDKTSNRYKILTNVREVFIKIDGDGYWRGLHGKWRREWSVDLDMCVKEAARRS